MPTPRRAASAERPDKHRPGIRSKPPVSSLGRSRLRAQHYGRNPQGEIRRNSNWFEVISRKTTMLAVRASLLPATAGPDLRNAILWVIHAVSLSDLIRPVPPNFEYLAKGLKDRSARRGRAEKWLLPSAICSWCLDPECFPGPRTCTICCRMAPPTPTPTDSARTPSISFLARFFSPVAGFSFLGPRQSCLDNFLEPNGPVSNEIHIPEK